MLDLSVSVYSPLSTTSSKTPVTRQINRNVVGYSHTTEAVGGFVSAQIELSTDISLIHDWVENGLARHIEVAGPAGDIVWEGFVNQVDVSVGGLDMSIGPITDIQNKVKVIYQTISWDIPDTPIRGVQKETSFASDTVSQDRFFILEGILNIGEASETLNQPTGIRDMHLSENAWPGVSQNVTIGSPSEPSMSISCVGYKHLLEKFYYSKVGTTSSMNASDKIVEVISAEPNNVFSSLTHRVEDNTTPVSDNEDGASTGWDVILSTLSYGTPNSNRYIVGFRENRTPYGIEIDPLDPNIAYNISLFGGRPAVRTYGGGGVVPQSIVSPGKWAFISDLVVGTSPELSSVNTIYRDPRFIFIESVSYDIDGGLTISGSTPERVDRAVAQIGLEGIYQ